MALAKMHDDVREDLTESFNMFAKKDGQIGDIVSYSKLMRQIGQNPTPAELVDQFRGPLTLNAFLERMANTMVIESALLYNLTIRKYFN
jgi:Ca2+-binding EF-hand superfamily protein